MYKYFILLNNLSQGENKAQTDVSIANNAVSRTVHAAAVSRRGKPFNAGENARGAAIGILHKLFG